MLTIARALMTNPSLLLMDGPSEGLGPIVVHEVDKVIRQLKEHGFSTLLVGENLSTALKVADYVYVICKSQTVYQATPDKLKIDEETKAKYLGVTC